MKLRELILEGALVLYDSWQDTREDSLSCYFSSLYYLNYLGIPDFVQDNHSKSSYGVLRGLHFQNEKPQAKLIRVIEGTIFDVIVDLRKDSSSFGQWLGIELSDTNNKMLYVPQGFAHGFLTLSENAQIVYKCSELYYKELESGIRWNDPQLNIDWPIKHIENIILSDKDKLLPFFKGKDRIE